MKIPKRLKIGIHRVRVDFVDLIDAPTEEGVACFGMAYTGSNLIELKTKQNEKKEAEHFLHELTHFVDSFAGLGLTENQVRGISTVLFMIIRDNHLDFSDKGRGE